MISYRHADLMNKFEDSQIYEPLWDYLRNIKESNVALVRLIRDITGYEAQNIMSEIGGIKIPTPVKFNYKIIPPEMRNMFMYWAKEEGENLLSLKSAKDIHDKWVRYNRTMHS